MTEILTKAQLLNGTREPQEIYFEDLGGSLRLYPLNDGQFSHALALAQYGVNAPRKGENAVVEMGSFESRKYKSDVYVASCGLSGGKEKWTEEEVSNLQPAGIVGKISDAVIQITKVSEDRIRYFRGVTGRASRDDLIALGLPPDGDSGPDASAADADSDVGSEAV